MNFSHLSALAAESGGILYLMPLLLLVALTLIIERFWFLSRVSRGVAATARDIAALHHLDRASIEAMRTRTLGQPQSRLLAVPLDYPEVSDPLRLGELLEEAILLEAPRIDRGVWLLDTIVTLAPLLGLLGTIIGMFNAFQILGQAGSAPTQVTGGIAEALVATAFGLLIAILGLVAFNNLTERVRHVVHRLETIKVMMVNRMDAPRGKAPRRAEEAARRPAPAPAPVMGTVG
ncbi:biopolymer transport protein ExbB [mine drainage metagenome]|uniref:Biopolymer transport protein ExbB n=1 Tax=mine drainage metagenome TaxID=410659 RepID=A0A1J5RRA5_9ZZZZ